MGSDGGITCRIAATTIAPCPRRDAGGLRPGHASSAITCRTAAKRLMSLRWRSSRNPQVDRERQR
jgi:hypothetical protein